MVKKSCEQIKYPSCPGEALSAISGTSRLPSLGTPGPTCQEGLPKIRLAPPPLEENPCEVTASFQVVSGIGPRADAPVGFPIPGVGSQEPLQKAVAGAQLLPVGTTAAGSPLNSSPPTPVTSEMLAVTSYP